MVRGPPFPLSTHKSLLSLKACVHLFAYLLFVLSCNRQSLAERCRAAGSVLASSGLV